MASTVIFSVFITFPTVLQKLSLLAYLSWNQDAKDIILSWIFFANIDTPSAGTEEVSGQAA